MVANARELSSIKHDDKIMSGSLAGCQGNACVYVCASVSDPDSGVLWIQNPNPDSGA